MDQMALQDIDKAVDLEGGQGTTNEEDASSDFVSSCKQPTTLLSRVCNAFANPPGAGDVGVNSCTNVSNLSGVPVPTENGYLLIHNELEEQDMTVHANREPVKQNSKKKSAKKAPKPPRPPRGPSLDAADLKLIQEINELALLKIAKIERAKALKKMKATKASSSNSTLFALVFTVFFFLVIIYHGMSSGSSSLGFNGSPESAAEDNRITIQNYYRSSLAKYPQQT